MKKKKMARMNAKQEDKMAAEPTVGGANDMVARRGRKWKGRSEPSTPQ